MKFTEVSSFHVEHQRLAWPWIAIDPTHSRFAFVCNGSIQTRVVTESGVAEGPRFALPPDLRLPSVAASAADHLDTFDLEGTHAFAIDPTGTLLAITARVAGVGVVVTIHATGATTRSRLDELTDDDFTARALAFDRTGSRVWLSLESGNETALLLIDAKTHEVFGLLRSEPFPPPASHQLYVHPQDDAVLLLAACGQDGTFARVAGFSNGPPELLKTSLDEGSVAAGFVGFSADGARVHLAEADELRTHAWPGLHELSSTQLEGDFVSSYSGAVLGSRVFVDGHDDDRNEDAVMIFDRTALRGGTAPNPVPQGMWVGRLGSDMIVTVTSSGEPSRGAVIRIPEPSN